MGEQKIYRINLTLQEFDSEGFWDVFHYTEIVDGNDKIGEYLENIISNLRKYMKKRGLK